MNNKFISALILSAVGIPSGYAANAYMQHNLVSDLPGVADQVNVDAAGIRQATLNRGVVGPNLSYFGSRETIGAGALANTPENLKTWIHNPGGVKPDNIMSTVIKEGMISDQDIDDIVAFLQSQTIPIDKPAEQ
jgi:cytochrome c1